MKTVRDACKLQDGALSVKLSDQDASSFDTARIAAFNGRNHGDLTQRALAVEISDHLARCLEEHRPEDASAARVLRELIKNQRLG
jgi:hypothetical protein